MCMREIWVTYVTKVTKVTKLTKVTKGVTKVTYMEIYIEILNSFGFDVKFTSCKGNFT